VVWVRAYLNLTVPGTTTDFSGRSLWARSRTFRSKTRYSSLAKRLLASRWLFSLVLFELRIVCLFVTECDVNLHMNTRYLCIKLSYHATRTHTDRKSVVELMFKCGDLNCFTNWASRKDSELIYIVKCLKHYGATLINLLKPSGNFTYHQV
jgi:hypothetical protein